MTPMTPKCIQKHLLRVVYTPKTVPRFEGSSPDSQQGVGAALAALWRVALLSSAELCDFVDASAEEETVTRDLN